MDKPSRVIFSLLFVIASVGSVLESRASSEIVPLTGTEAQDRSSIIASAARSMLTGNHIRVDQFVHAGREKFPCESLQITATGAVCDGYYLDFPEVLMKDVLVGDSHLPRRSITAFISEKLVGSIVYRNLSLSLHWEPATPEFLQIHLEEYLPYWENRIPYRLFWNAQYAICSQNCSTFQDEGEFLPTDIEDLLPSLAADINFNGVPAAFWNTRVNP